MSIVFDHRDAGTAEEDWLAAAPWRGAGELVVAAERLIVLAAHPDDETLGAGGLIMLAAAAGIEVTVVIATDGEASHPESAPEAPRRLTRRVEATTALADLAPAAGLRFLGLRDGGLREDADALRAAIDRELGRAPEGVLLAAPWWGDGHRDHRVLGELAARFRQPGVRVVGYPIWLWHWGDPGAVVTDHWRTLPLPPWVAVAKARAIGRHRSQTIPGTSEPGDAAILQDEMAAHFRRDVEVFIEHESTSAGSVPVATFEEFFRRHDDPWGFATRWYEERKRSLLLAALPRQRFSHALELGCATGMLTTELARRADRVLGVDAAGAAIAEASRRFAGDDAVSLERLILPGEWPAGRFDLIVLSELGYYWDLADLSTALARIDESLTADGILVACHWRHPIGEAPLTGDQVHAVLTAAPGWERAVHHVEADFVLDVFTRPGAPSVAAAEGLV